jgi:hypothetical protein
MSTISDGDKPAKALKISEDSGILRARSSWEIAVTMNVNITRLRQTTLQGEHSQASM